MGFNLPETSNVQAGASPKGKAVARTESPEEEMSLALR